MVLVYEPTEDSFLLKKKIKKYVQGKNVLDMGCGGGVLSVEAKKCGARKVLGVDINSECGKYLEKLGINFLESDLFKKVEGKFDIILFNPPYLPEDEREDFESRVITTGGKNGDELVLRFLNDVGNYLEKDGKILLLVSSLTSFGRIKKILKEKGMVYSIIAEKKLFFEKLEVWEIGFG
jgi:release factor glutamine methyltransferase